MKTETKPRQVLIVGNGFDIAQGLPTSYTDFIEFLRLPNPEKLIYRVKNGEEINQIYRKYFGEVTRIDLAELKRMDSLKANNSWVKYFMECNAEIKGWIDLEREMLPVFDFFHWMFEQEYKITGDGKGSYAHIEMQDEKKYRLCSILPKFVTRYGSNNFSYIMRVQPEYVDSQYGIIKDKIIETLKRDLDDFIEIFRIYLREIIDQVNRKHTTIIDNLEADTIINFNYVQSELFLKKLKDAECIHVHGDTTKPGNMVLGVNEVPDDENNEFLYFTKSFQRIKVRSNPKYRNYWEGDFHATFFGHSLDITDVEIIKPFYSDASHVRVFYHGDRDYENKIINLIKMVGVEKVERDVYDGRLELIQC